MDKSVFDGWEKVLNDFKSSVEKDLNEIRQHKAEVVSIRQQIYDEINSIKYIRDDQRLVLSAPEIVIGNVDPYGDLFPGTVSKITLRGSNINIEGAGVVGEVNVKAPVIKQEAINPGLDGEEEVIESVSQIITRAKSVIIQANNDMDLFTSPISGMEGGVTIHADTVLKIDSSIESDSKKKRIENLETTLSQQKNSVKSEVDAHKKNFESLIKEMGDLIKKQENLLDSVDDARANIHDAFDLNEDIANLSVSLFAAFGDYSHTISKLAEIYRKIKALKDQKEKIVTGDKYKNSTTGSSISLTSENIKLDSIDGEGQNRTNPGAGVFVRANQMNLSSTDDKGKLNVEGSITLSAMNLNIKSLESKDLKFDNKGKLSGGEYQTLGKVNIQAKKINLEALDYEVKDGELKEKALTKEGILNVRVEKAGVSTNDNEGKATGEISLNSKTINIKSTDIDTEKNTDKSLAQGSSMLLLSEKMFIGSKNKDIQSKLVQTSSEKVGTFAKTTFEVQQGEKKSVVQLSDGKASLSGDNTEIYGKTTVNGATEFKDSIKGPKADIDSVNAKSSFKSPNISDGMSAGGGGGSGSLSTKLEQEEIEQK